MKKQEVKEKIPNNINSQYQGNENAYSSKRGKPKLKNSKSTTIMQSDNLHRGDRVLRESRSVSWNVPVYVSKKDRQLQGKVKKSAKQTSYPQASGPFGDSRSQKQQSITLLEDEPQQSTDGRLSTTCKSPSVEKKYQQPTKKKATVSIRARYWAYLFENLKHAVDEIYVTCEGDASVVECKEVLMVLDTYHHDFQALIDWINLQEKLKKSNDQDRPTSLAWEVRKSSPGRPRQKLTPRSQKSQNSSNRDTKPKAHTPTWADRVRGLQHVVGDKKPVDMNNSLTSDKATSDSTTHPSSATEVDDEGWQMVARSRQPKSQLSGLDGNTRGLNKIKLRNGKLSKETSPLVAVGNHDKLTNGASPNEGGGYINVTLATNTKISPIKDEKQTASNCDEAPFSNYVADRITETQNMTAELPQKSLFQEDADDKLKNLEELEKDFFITDPSNQDFEIECELTESGNIKEAPVTSAKLREADASIAAYEQEEEDLMKEIEAEKKKTIDVEVNTASTVLLNKTETSLNETRASWDEVMAEFDAEQSSGQSWADLVEEELREPGRVVQMHEKLSSPSRRTHRESRQDLDLKLQSAAYRREKMLKEKAENIRNLTERVNEVRELKNNVLTQRRIYVHEAHIVKLQRAQDQREMRLKNVVRKAKVEDTKVNEIAFINELQEQNRRQEVRSRIMEHEARMEEIVQERNKMQEVKAAKEENVKERRRALEKERQEWIVDLVNKRKEHEARIEQTRIEKEKEREKVAKERAREREIRLSALSAAQQEAVSELQKKIQLKHDESERRHQEQLDQRKEKALELSLGKFTVTPMTPGGSKDITCLPATDKQTIVPAFSLSELDTIENQCLNSDNATNSSPRTDDLQAKAHELLLEKRKSMKKRMKKVRTRMLQKAMEFNRSYSFVKKKSEKSKLPRLIKDVTRIVTSLNTTTGSWLSKDINALDRAIGEINRTLEKAGVQEKHIFREHGGFNCLELTLNCVSLNTSNDAALPQKSIMNAAYMLLWSCHNCIENSIFVLFSSHFCSAVDVLSAQLMGNLSDKRMSSPTKQSSKNSMNHDDMFSPAATALMRALSVVISTLSKWPIKSNEIHKIISGSADLTRITTTIVNEKPHDEASKHFVNLYWNRSLDVISYIVSSAILDMLRQYLGSIHYEVAADSKTTIFIRYSLAFLSSLINLIAMKTSQIAKEGNNNNSWSSDITNLSATLYTTEVVGVVSVLYGVLLQGAPERPTTLSNRRSNMTDDDNSRNEISPHILGISMSVFNVLNAIAYYNIHLLQACLGADGVSLEYRHICTYLLWYCKQDDHAELLHDVITSIGHFTLAHSSNQDLVNSGAMPTVLQQLCLLPFSYFSNPRLTKLLFPTLIACCHLHEDNLKVLQEEASPLLLSNFIETSMITNENQEDEDEKKSGGQQQSSNTRMDVVANKLYTNEFLKSALEFFSKCQRN